jgi:peptidoglycan/xylan/chitin deacetylase (PgdA/CDA1 family)
MRQLTGGAESNIFRPPFGDWNRRVHDAAYSLGMRLVMWDLDTNDWRGGSEQEIVDLIVTYANPGDNVLMHLQHNAFTTSALDGIQAGLRARGMELCRPARPNYRPTPVHLPDNIC